MSQTGDLFKMKNRMPKSNIKIAKQHLKILVIFEIKVFET